MNDDIKLMIENYKTYDVDWMNDIISSPSELTRHHIVKKENDGEDDISNYAILTKNSHILLHYLEKHYYGYYTRLNTLFLELNRSLLPPSEEYYNEVKTIIKKVKKDIKNKNRNRRKK